MATKPAPSDPAQAAISKAEALVRELESSGGTQRSILTKAGGTVPAIRDWRVPVIIALVLFGAQAWVSSVVDDTTVATIFAVGAVTVAILTGIVATLSYAQQSAIPFADFLAIVKELLVALKAVKAHDGDGGGSAGGGDGSGHTGDERPTETINTSSPANQGARPGS